MLLKLHGTVTGLFGNSNVDFGFWGTEDMLVYCLLCAGQLAHSESTHNAQPRDPAARRTACGVSTIFLLATKDLSCDPLKLDSFDVIGTDKEASTIDWHVPQQTAATI